jgi:hypothetical protein
MRHRPLGTQPLQTNPSREYQICLSIREMRGEKRKEKEGVISAPFHKEFAVRVDQISF